MDVEKETLERMNKIIVLCVSNNFLNKPLGDNTWTSFQMDRCFKLTSNVYDNNINFFLRSTIGSRSS